MNFFDKIKSQRFLSFSLLTFTLCAGVLIGTVLNTGVYAAKEGQAVAPDATPLVIPKPTTLETDFTRLAKRVEPSVVNISTDYTPKQSTAQRERGRQGAPQGEEEEQLDFFRRFFGGPGGPGGGSSPFGRMPSPRRSGTGSGFIVDPNGYILTNYHVVDGANKIKVTVPEDQTEYAAKLIGFDRETDLAVIKIENGKKLPALKVGNSDGVEVGDWAVAIGSPFGLEATMTAGIVSAKGRSQIAGAAQFQSFIQTDAAINPGNSGGPLLNINGEVIGVNTAIATSSGGSQGVGFALPINTAVKAYNQIIKHGRVTRGSIGVSFSRSEDPQLLRALGVSHGVLVTEVEESGPAAKAGIRREDVIVAINGHAIKNGDDLLGQVADAPVGDTAKITVDRAGKKLDLNVVVADRVKLYANRPDIAGEQPEEILPSTGQNEAKFGIAIVNLPEPERERMGIEEKGGVQVTRVEEESFAADIGLREGDVIMSINRVPVGNVDDVKKIQATLKGGDAIAIRVTRPLPQGMRRQPGQSNTFFLSGALPKN